MKRIICLATACMMLVATMVFSLSVSAADETFSAVKAVRISDTEIAVEFSEDLPGDTPTFTNCWVSLRWYTLNEDGTPKSLATDPSLSQQGKTSVAFWTNSDGTQVKSVVVLTFAEKDRVDYFAAPAEDNPYKDTCTAFVAFEEIVYAKDENGEYVLVDGKKTNQGTEDINDHAAVDTITSASGKVLTANCCKSGINWDAACVSITTDYSWTPTGGTAHTPNAPNTADSSVLMVSVAAAALICGAAVIGSKKKH